MRDIACLLEEFERHLCIIRFSESDVRDLVLRIYVRDSVLKKSSKDGCLLLLRHEPKNKAFHLMRDDGGKLLELAKSAVLEDTDSFLGRRSG